MEAIIVLVLIGGIVAIVATSISINNIKYKVQGLQKEVHDLSDKLEKSLKQNEFNEAKNMDRQEEKVSEGDASFAFDYEEARTDEDLDKEARTDEDLDKEVRTYEDLDKETSSGQDYSDQEIIRTAHMNQSSDLKQYKSVTNKNEHINRVDKIDVKASSLAGTSNKNISSKSANNKNTNSKTNQEKTLNKVKSNLFSIESIISKLGIFLLLIGVGYMYKLAYDNGYVTPNLIVTFGYILGLLVLGLGIRVSRKNREVLSQVLFGGGVAILYITTFAAYQGYGLIKGFLAFIILFVITFLAFFIALSADSVAMSIVALLGSVLTPFIVGIDVLGLYGTGLYILFIAAGSMAIYIFKRWRILQLTSIISINIVTLLLSSSGDFSTRETIEFSILLVAILFVFYGVEYMHYYLMKNNAKELGLTAGLMSALPIVTLFQALMVLDLTKTTWAIIFTMITLIFFGLNYLLYKKRQHSLITDILMGYIGLFALIGIVLYFGGEVRYIAILLLSVIFTLIHAKSGYFLTRLMGLIIYSIGYIWALGDLAVNIIRDDIDFITIVVRLIVVVIITFLAMMQKDFLRKVLGGLALQGYFFIAFMSMVLTWTEDVIDPVVMILAIFGVFMIFFIYLHKKFALLSIHALVLMCSLPFLVKIISSGLLFYGEEIDWMQVIAFIIYGIEMYVVSLTLLKNDKKGFVFILKTVAYTMMASIALVEIPIWSDHFGYGLVVLACLTVVMDYFEAKEDKLMHILSIIYKIAFIALFVIYLVAITGMIEFNFIHLFFDLMMIVLVYYFVKDFIKEDWILFVMNTLIFMLVIYQNLSMTDNGIVTLFWAAYSIISLGYFLFKGNRKLVYISLGLVVFVAAKFILIDLSTIDLFWKIVTSMAFGAALLVLSYFIQPLLDKYEDNVSENTKE